MHIKMEGILLVNKPKGPTSFHIIKKLRRVTGVRKIGHAGTLDPDARGLLLVAFNKATKSIQLLQQLQKEYVAKILLGIRTDTDDVSGKVLSRNSVPPISNDAMKRVLADFVGRIQQVPPKFSAVKYRGERAYKLAREGRDFTLKAKEVSISVLSILYYQNPFLRVIVECSKGTYMRAIARDVGEMLGCGGTLFSLLRRRIGGWNLREALRDDQLMDREVIENHLISLKNLKTLLSGMVMAHSGVCSIA